MFLRGNEYLHPQRDAKLLQMTRSNVSGCHRNIKTLYYGYRLQCYVNMYLFLQNRHSLPNRLYNCWNMFKNKVDTYLWRAGYT